MNVRLLAFPLPSGGARVGVGKADSDCNKLPLSAEGRLADQRETANTLLWRSFLVFVNLGKLVVHRWL